MATLRERLRASREAQRRKLQSFTIGVSEDDLRVIAKHGYGGAISTDHEQQAQAVGLFLSDALLQTDRVNRRSNVRVTA
jgi:transcriptional antiterminator